MWTDQDSSAEPPALIVLILEYFDGGEWPGARKIWEEAELTNDERAELFSFFDSKQRAYLKDEDRQYLREENLWVDK